MLEIKISYKENGRMDKNATIAAAIEKIKTLKAKEEKELIEQAPPPPIVTRSILNHEKKLILCHDDKIMALKLVKETSLTDTVNKLAEQFRVNPYIVREALVKLLQTTVLVSDGLVEKIFPTMIVHVRSHKRTQPRALLDVYFDGLPSEKVSELKNAAKELQNREKRNRFAHLEE